MSWPGIGNENQFYSEHYLSEIFSRDVGEALGRWQEAEQKAREAHKGEQLADEQLAP